MFKTAVTAPGERKYAGLALDDVALDGTFSGYASLFGAVDLGKDAVERGAFARSQEVIAGGEFVALLGDQDAGRKGQFVDFLGRPASVNRGVATMAMKARCPIIMAFVFRQPDGSHVMRVEPPLEIDPAWSEEEGIARLTERHTARLEAAVREAPDQYYWIHRRWKTQPPDAADDGGGRS